MTAILENPTTTDAAPAEQAAPRGLCAALPLAPRAADVCPMSGGEWCPDDQKKIDQCTAC